MPMDSPHPLYRFSTLARAFLARAEERLATFEETDALESFFYSALELRFGIEARLNEYLAPALKSIGKDSTNISEYVATKLLKQLISIDPDAVRPSTIRITGEQHARSTTMQFTPVTSRLASIHGQLGELLHFKFFTNNEHWYIRKPLGSNPHRSVADFIPLLREGIAELRAATSGTLLANPQFTEVVREVAEQAPRESGFEGEG
jgi:hypothetical protein